MPVDLYITGHGGTFQGIRDTLDWPRMFTPVHAPSKGLCANPVAGVLDSGAFSDAPESRLTVAAALERQLRWERLASLVWGVSWQASRLVSYDLLIDEWWVGGVRAKQRWTAPMAESAVEETVNAAAYLASQRARLFPRKLVLSAQGVDISQYMRCVRGVLAVASPGDWLALGGWCIIGRNKRMLSAFVETLEQAMPAARRAGVSHVHLFGVLWLPALSAFSAIARREGLTCSTDSTKPIRDCCCKPEYRAKAGARCADWRDNVDWWNRTLQALP